MVVIPLVGKDGSTYNVRALLDSGSGSNFICKDILPHLDYEYLATKQMKVTGINTTEKRTYDLVNVSIANTDCPVKKFKCYTLPNIVKYQVDKKVYNALMSDCIDLPNFSDPLKFKTEHGEGFGLILGPGAIGDISAKSPTYFKSYLVDHTFFGPAISGRLPSTSQMSVFRADLNINFFKDSIADEKYFFDESSIDAKIQLLEDLQFMRDKELLGVKANELHQDDALCIENFKKEVVYDSNRKQYTVALPFKNNKNMLPSNEWIALKRTQILQRNFMKDKSYGSQYADQIDKLLKKGFIEEVLPHTQVGNLIHYLPHRGIVKEESKTTSLRIVMDASCKANASSLSLNDCLYTGPNLIVSMCFLLLKFRTEKYGASADIEKAFLNLTIRVLDRDALRFFFPSQIFNPESKMRVFRYKVVMFGASCSPFLLAAVIEVHIDKHIQDRILQESLKSIFIDNLLISKESEIELLKFYYKARQVYADMGLNLRQWASNSKLLVEAAKRDGVWDESPQVKVLGHLWDPGLDELSLKESLKLKEKRTKRIVVATGNQLVDTYGIILPIEMRYRIFTQKLWKLGYNWDIIFREEKLVTEWKQIQSEMLLALKKAKFPRTMETLENVELHIFSDASFGAYGAVAYFIVPSCEKYPEGLAQIRFSKGKVVSPNKCPKQDTIPKLELMGIVMAASAAANLIKAYDKINFKRKILWSDNKTALSQCSRISNDTNFVHNRVVDIRRFCPDFEIKYVASEDNPADFITKPVSVEKLFSTNLWLKGPEWLPNKDKWETGDNYNLHPEVPQNPANEWCTGSETLERVEMNTMYGNIYSFQTRTNLDSASSYYWDFGDYTSCLKFFLGLELIKSFIKGKTKIEHHIITYNEMRSAERLAIKTMQLQCFPKELKSLQKGERVQNPKFFQLKLYLDRYGIIRIQGRLRDEHFTKTNKPILFGYRHPFTILFILNRHKGYNCSSKDYTLNKVRREIHSFKLRRQIVEIVNKCIICRKNLNKPFRHQGHPPLNDYRTISDRPFSMCGVDYIGPFVIYRNSDLIEIAPDGKKKDPKAWIVMFSCLVTRAIYMVLVYDRSTESFLRALRELSGRHCEPKLFISDNEGAFVAANKVLQRIANSASVLYELGHKGITWKFLPSRAAWMGGVYERLVQIIKIELMKIQGKAKFNESEWRSHLVEIEQIVNDRPLTYVTDSPSEPDVITPNAYLHGCSNNTTIATDINIDKAIADLKQYQNHPEQLYREKIKMKEQFWKRIQSQYIAALNLSNFQKNKSRGRYSSIEPEVGRVVSIVDNETKLGGRLGIIVQLLPSSDGVARRALVKTTIPQPHVSLWKNLKTEIREKALCHLIPLELKVDTWDEPIPSEDISQNSNTETEDQSPNENDSFNRSQMGDIELDTGEPCGMPDCKRPVAEHKNINWVCCDNCNRWCHYDCVDLPETAKYGKEDPYTCPICEPPFEGFTSQDQYNPENQIVNQSKSQNLGNPENQIVNQSESQNLGNPENQEKISSASEKLETTNKQSKNPSKNQEKTKVKASNDLPNEATVPRKSDRQAKIKCKEKIKSWTE